MESIQNISGVEMELIRGGLWLGSTKWGRLHGPPNEPKYIGVRAVGVVRSIGVVPLAVPAFLVLLRAVLHDGMFTWIAHGCRSVPPTNGSRRCGGIPLCGQRGVARRVVQAMGRDRGESRRHVGMLDAMVARLDALTTEAAQQTLDIDARFVRCEGVVTPAAAGCEEGDSRSTCPQSSCPRRLCRRHRLRTSRSPRGVMRMARALDHERPPGLRAAHTRGE